jgi:hypothetical protein
MGLLCEYFQFPAHIHSQKMSGVYGDRWFSNCENPKFSATYLYGNPTWKIYWNITHYTTDI